MSVGIGPYQRIWTFYKIAQAWSSFTYCKFKVLQLILKWIEVLDPGFATSVHKHFCVKSSPAKLLACVLG